MAFVKRTWLARIGTGLNKFIIGEKDANDKQTLVNSPDSVSQQGDVISADNLNDLEDRIEDGFDDAHTEMVNGLATKQNTLPFDNVPTSGSNNPVKSGGIYTTIEGLKLTLAWENPNPTSQLGEVTVSTTSLVGVTDIVIGYRVSDTNAVLYQRASHRTGGGGPFTIPFQYCTIDENSRMVIVSRTIYYTPNYGRIATTNCVYAYTDGSSVVTSISNSYLVPIFVYKVGNISN